MPIPQYIVTLASIAESNETLIAKKTIKVLKCSLGIPESNACNLWNYNKCPNDASYCIPFVPGDILYSQFHAPVEYYQNVQYDIINTATGLPISPSPLTIQKGKDDKNTAFINFLIDTTALTVNCFYLRIKTFKCKLNRDQENELKDCIYDLMEEGKTKDEASDICFTNLCQEGIEYFYSEPWCNSMCRPTILVEGTYPQYDCNNSFYGLFQPTLIGGPAPILIPNPNFYKLQFRVFGEVNKVNFDVEAVKYKRKRKSTTLLTAFELLTKRIPEYMADRFALVFAAEHIYVDGVEYEDAVNLSKNLEEGKMWSIKSTLLQQCGPIDFTCNQ